MYSNYLAILHVYVIISEPSTSPRSLTLLDVVLTSVTLSWLAPDIPNGIITQYELQYTVCSDSFLVNVTNLVTDDNSHIGTIEGLSSVAVYSLSVRAYTVVGPGPFSDHGVTAVTPAECMFVL